MTKIEGPFSFKAADGLKTPVYMYKPGGVRMNIGEVTVKVDNGMTFEVQLDEAYKDIEMAGFDVPMRYTYLKESNQKAMTEEQKQRALIHDAQAMHEKGKSNAWIANALGVSENTVRTLVINWGYNCLTIGVHHGRPEAIWKLPLFQAAHMFSADDLKELVVTRIYNDAMQFVEHSDTDHHITTPEWADKIKEYASAEYRNQLQHKIGEITNYYRSERCKLDQKDVVERVKQDNLNPNYKPLHDHDSINMLCRIIGVRCSEKATKDLA